MSLDMKYIFFVSVVYQIHLLYFLSTQGHSTFYGFYIFLTVFRYGYTPGWVMHGNL